MGAGRGQVRSRGPQVRSESGVFPIVRDLVGGAVAEAVAVAVHLQDVDVAGEPVQQRAGEAFRSEHLGPLVERQVGGDQDGTPLVALAEDLEEQFRSGGGQGDRGTKPNSSMVSGLSSRLSSLASSGPLYLVFTGATPRRGYPGGVLRQHGTAGPPGLPHDRGVRRDGSGRRPWLETALFTAPAGNSPLS